MTFAVSLGALVFVLCVAGVGLVRRYTIKRAVLAMPNHRSSHSVPVPTGGGLGFVAAVVLTLGILFLTEPTAIQVRYLLAALAVTCLLAAVGWLDDTERASIRTRVAMHVAAATVIAILVNSVAPVPGLLNVLWLLWWTFWTIASINIVNFMDGIDGMIASQGVVYALYVTLLGGPRTLAFAYGIVLACACAAFLVWNWSPARIFMGDVGSAPLGLLFILGGVLLLNTSRVPLIFLPLLPLYLDALLTMLARARLGQRLTDAHRTHLYQRIANGGAGHPAVSLAYAGAAAMGAVLGLTLRAASGAITTLSIAAYALIALAAWRYLDRRYLLQESIERQGST